MTENLPAAPSVGEGAGRREKPTEIEATAALPQSPYPEADASGSLSSALSPLAKPLKPAGRFTPVGKEELDRAESSPKRPPIDLASDGDLGGQPGDRCGVDRVFFATSDPRRLVQAD